MKMRTIPEMIDGLRTLHDEALSDEYLWASKLLNDAANYIKSIHTENARLREAATEYVRAMEGFTESIRAATGRAYPWPAQEITLTKLLAALDLDGQKERRAKALSELAEMDADLLDIDPEKKP